MKQFSILNILLVIMIVALALHCYQLRVENKVLMENSGIYRSTARALRDLRARFPVELRKEGKLPTLTMGVVEWGQDRNIVELYDIGFDPPKMISASVPLTNFGGPRIVPIRRSGLS